MLRNPDAAGPGTSRFIVYKTKSGGGSMLRNPNAAVRILLIKPVVLHQRGQYLPE